MMGSYSLSNALRQSPEKIKWWVLGVLGLILGMKGVEASVLDTLGVGLVIERTLDLFYVAPTKVAQAARVAKEHTDEKRTAALQGIQLGQSLGSRPLRAPDKPDA